VKAPGRRQLHVLRCASRFPVHHDRHGGLDRRPERDRAPLPAGKPL